MSATSVNFAFLASHDPFLAALGAQAEKYFAEDAAVALIKLRQLGEQLAQRTAAYAGIYTSAQENQVDLLRRLQDRGVFRRDTADLFHSLRRAGNAAAHESKGDRLEALQQLKLARKLAVWFHEQFGPAGFKPGPFVPPPEPKDESRALREEIERLTAAAAKAKLEAEQQRALAEQARLESLSAAERAKQEAEERATWEALAVDYEKKLGEKLAEIQAATAKQPPAKVEALIAKAADAAEKIELDESGTRRLIDAQLRDAGWEVDSATMTYAAGVRPQLGKNIAIAEWPTANGPADYVLFIGLTPVAVVEAKRSAKDVSASIEQAKRYSRGLEITDDLVAAESAPWGKYRVPFLFATNGRKFLRQLATKSGIWFLDARRKENHPRPLEGWITPEGLKAQLAQDIDQAHEALRHEPTQYLGLRDYQIRAIRKVEEAIASGQREILVAMATGTGKTRTTIGLVYRLLKTKRFRRILFLVDRNALGEQTENAFKDARLENLQTFTDIFELKGLADIKPDKTTKVHVTTIQAMVKRVIVNEEEDSPDVPPVDAYDCIIVDECHRGYLLDRELGDDELTFRNEADYISKYRRVLDHFDAVKIGLTATPALHTTEIFGKPVETYAYRDAVIEGFLVDHEPPIRIVTALAQDGMTWRAGEEMVTYDPSTKSVNTVELPDEVELDIDSYNRKVLTENFNKVVCQRLAKHIDPRLDEKTIIFCVTDDHADTVVRLLKEAMDAEYGGIDDDAIVKITGSADKPAQLIRRFRNEHLPTVAVTVDLLTTGIDVPKVCNLVFLRRVRSRILYDQMLGRATRLCDEIKKEAFRVFDAVDLYAALAPLTAMKPVVQNPKISFETIAKDLQTQTAPSVRELLLDQLLAKLQGKQRRMSEESRERFRELSGLDPRAFIEKLRREGAGAAAEWLASNPALPKFLDGATAATQPLIVSQHADSLRDESRGYGNASRPEDYLAGFTDFLRRNLNLMPALTVVVQRPRELTRAQLKELRSALHYAGYTETFLQTAWRETTNANIAATIIGFIRQAALGDPLVPYEERVDRAAKKILASRAWSTSQRKWLERIAKQMKLEVVVDRTSLDEGTFREQAGGFDKLNKQFNGELDTILGDLRDEIWSRTA